MNQLGIPRRPLEVRVALQTHNVAQEVGMAYSALVRRLLISCPGDIPTGDLAIVQEAIIRWNGVYGESFGAVVLPIYWRTHAAAEFKFGSFPQDILDKQLVDQCDICIVLFANRLGTPTAAAESGTAEEIERLGKSGRYVGILRSRRPVQPDSIDFEQARNLEDYLARITNNALVLGYASDAELSQRVDTILASAIARDQGRADLQLQQTSTQRAIRVAEVWPRIESSERTSPPGKGALHSPDSGPEQYPEIIGRNWRLVLSNTGDAPARDVRVRIEPSNTAGESWTIHGGSADSKPEIEVLAPHNDVKFPIFPNGRTPQVRCIVRWTDDRGEQENTATLRLT